MWIRIFLASVTLLSLTVLIWTAGHISETPTILGRYSPSYFTLLLFIGGLCFFSLLFQVGFLYKRLNNMRREFFLILFSMLFSLGAIEIAIRIFDPIGISYFQATHNYQLDKIADPHLIFKHSPLLERTYEGVQVSTNELGMRDRPMENMGDDSLRILLLGDSVTFGWGVPIEKTFGRRLETLLPPQIGQSVRTFNTGVGGYNTDQEYMTLKKYFRIINPDIVILVYIYNDIEINLPPFDPRINTSLEGKSPPKVLSILLKRSWLYRLVNFTKQNYSEQKPLANFNHNNNGVRHSLEALRAIGKFLQDRKIPFVTFYYPPGIPSLSKDTSTDSLYLELSTIGQTYGFPVIDMSPWWGQTDIRLTTNSIVDSHPNQLGHEILAIGMSNFLIKNSYFNNNAETSYILGSPGPNNS